jgi:DNA invertase Pin-like site-specific DNA recombinase
MTMENKTIAYLRVSTVEQDLEKNKADILTFANNKDFGRVTFVEEKVSGMKNWKHRKIKQIILQFNLIP